MRGRGQRPQSLHRRHYMHRVPEVQALLAAGDEAHAERVLVEILDATEHADLVHGVAPWYYERLAILYAKQQRHADEIAVLERFARQAHAPGAKPAKLIARLTALQDRAAVTRLVQS